MKKEKLLEILHFSDIHPYDIQKIIDNFNNQQQEIDRLNKIIKELKKYIEAEIFLLPPLEYQTTNDLCIYNNILYKLKKLKEEGK